jgi:hypothetical protein
MTSALILVPLFAGALWIGEVPASPLGGCFVVMVMVDQEWLGTKSLHCAEDVHAELHISSMIIVGYGVRVHVPFPEGWKHLPRFGIAYTFGMDEAYVNEVWVPVRIVDEKSNA